jgi:excisionase family DNA binding protein
VARVRAVLQEACLLNGRFHRGTFADFDFFGRTAQTQHFDLHETSPGWIVKKPCNRRALAFISSYARKPPGRGLTARHPIRKPLSRRGICWKISALNAGVANTGKFSIYSHLNKTGPKGLRSEEGLPRYNPSSPLNPALLITAEQPAFPKCGATINERTSMTDNQSLLLKSSEAANRLGISTSTLHRWVKAGRIECVRIERNSVYFTHQALEDFVRRHRKEYRPHNVA